MPTKIAHCLTMIANNIFGDTGCNNTKTTTAATAIATAEITIVMKMQDK